MTEQSERRDRPRYYLTTSIAYANNKPGLHTLYEVIGADVIARWHRMSGDDTRFLTGTDEHSINIAQSALDEGRSPRAFVDEKVGFFKGAEAALGISPDRFIRTTDPDHIRSAQEMVRRAFANGDIYLGTYEGWYCPNEGFRNATDVVETARGTICPNHPDVPLQWLTERNWFFRLSAYQERLERHFADHPEFVQPDYRRNEMLGFIRGGLEDFSISRERTPGGWGIPFPVAENGESSLLEDGSWDPEAGKIYVWFDALINYITGAGFPDDATAFERWWPADLHVIGKDIARFHTIFWPAMLWSAGLEAPRQVWVHGWLLAAGGERMSKSRGNFLDPNDFVAAFGQDGARYVALREVPFDRDAEVSWDSFVRRYNADLANDFGNLVNRTVSMTNRYLAGERPAPRSGPDSPLAQGWAETLERYAQRLAGCRLHDALGELWDYVGAANRTVDGEQPWVLAKAARAGDDEAEGRLRDVLGDLLEACRLLGLAVAPFLPATAPRVMAQLGFGYPYGDDGNGGPAILGLLGWGSQAGREGRVTAAEPLFPASRLNPRHPEPGVRLIDSHCHLNADRFDNDVDLVVGGARLAGIERLLVPGWNVASSERALAVVDRHPWLDAAVGVHPHDAAKVDDDGWAVINRWASDPRVVAIGETGLDFDRLFSPIPDQLTNLRRNLQLARETGKPAILHCRSADGARDAQDTLVDELRMAGVGGPAWAAAFGDRPPAIIHSYSGPADYARTIVDLGLAVSFSGLVFRQGEEDAGTAAAIAFPDRILVETDSPFLSPPGAPRKRNEPEWVVITARWLAEQRGLALESLGPTLVASYDRTLPSQRRET